MDIERINENTLKLFITYNDIEDRGYSREEIWYNRSKGEELFWDVIGEVNTEDYFDLEGPIWIHINASEQGLEVIVTRANMADAENTSTPHVEEHTQMASHLKEMEDALFEALDAEVIEQENAANLRFFFKDIDEVIPVAKRFGHLGIATSLYQYEGYYYLVMHTSSMEDADKVKNMNAVVKEYLRPSKVTIHRLQEYGQLIMDHNCFEQMNEYFA